MNLIEKPNVLILGHYLPAHKVGGPVVSIINLIKNLSDDFNFKVLAPDRDFGEKKPYSDIESNKWIDLNGVQVFYVPINLLTSFVLLRELKKKINSNTILYVNSVFNFQFSIFIALAKKIGLLKVENLLISPRGELLDEALGFKSNKKLFFLHLVKFINLYKNVIWHATTENEKAFIVRKLGINPSNIRVAMIMSNINDNTFNTETQVNQQIEETFDGIKRFRIVYLARISKDKNILFTFEILKNLTTPIVFDIYGQIEEEDLWLECQKKIKQLPLNIRVNYCGVINHATVKKTLSTYDLFFLPTFAENFGHAIAESLSVGTPVLISDNTPWRNLESEKMGWDINLHKPDLFITAINQLASYSPGERRFNRNLIKEAAQKRLNNPEILLANKNLFKLPFTSTEILN